MELIVEVGSCFDERTSSTWPNRLIPDQVAANLSWRFVSQKASPATPSSYSAAAFLAYAEARVPVPPWMRYTAEALPSIT